MYLVHLQTNKNIKSLYSSAVIDMCTGNKAYSLFVFSLGKRMKSCSRRRKTFIINLLVREVLQYGGDHYKKYGGDLYKQYGGDPV